MFPPHSVGKQCVTNCAVALLQSRLKDPADWRPDTLNLILCEGSILYCNVISTQDLGPEGYLSLDDLPENIDCFSQTFQLIGHVNRSGLVEGSDNLGLALGQNTNSTDQILILQTYAIAVLQQPSRHKYYVFDPHSRDRMGKPCADGRSVLLQFESRDEMFR